MRWTWRAKAISTKSISRRFASEWRRTLTSSLLEIAAVLAAAHLFGMVFRWFGQPRVMGEMTAGILLGPSLLAWAAPGLFAHLFPSDGIATLNTLSQVGLILFLFVVGMEARLPDTEGLGSLTATASVANLLTPLLL